jgi:hypothetical protein
MLGFRRIGCGAAVKTKDVHERIFLFPSLLINIRAGVDVAKASPKQPRLCVFHRDFVSPFSFFFVYATVMQCVWRF